MFDMTMIACTCTHTHHMYRSMHDTQTHTHTNKQPLTFMQVSTPRVSTSNASTATVRRRSSELRAARKRLSGGDDSAQLLSEITAREINRREIMEKLESMPGRFQIKIPAEQVLAMKVDLQIPWRKLLMRK